MFSSVFSPVLVPFSLFVRAPAYPAVPGKSAIKWHVVVDVLMPLCGSVSTTRCSCSALTLQVEWQEGHPAHKNPVVVPVNLSFVRAPAHSGVRELKGRKTVDVVIVWLCVCVCISLSLYACLCMFLYISLCTCLCVQIVTNKTQTRKWANDEEILACQSCNKLFSVTVRKVRCSQSLSAASVTG